MDGLAFSILTAEIIHVQPGPTEEYMVDRTSWGISTGRRDGLGRVLDTKGKNAIR